MEAMKSDLRDLRDLRDLIATANHEKIPSSILYGRESCELRPIPSVV